MLPERYDPILVVMSYVVALFGSITALRMGARVATQGGRLRPRWLIGGALAQGMGVWGMHFTGMLAFHIPVPIAYDVPVMLLSYLVASAGALFGLILTQRPTLSAPWLGAGGLSIGAGISGLHYLDMAAMRMAARTHYASLPVLASIVVACVFGLLSLWLGRRHQRDDPRRSRRSLWMAGAIMGVAIVGQHFTGMSAVDFSADPDALPLASRHALPADELPRVVLLATGAILVVTIVAMDADRRRTAQAMLSQRLLAAQESERRRFARVLHDDLGQTLTALRLNLQRLSPAANDARIIEDSTALVDDALARVRALSVELRPSVLDDLGLGAAVEWYAKRSGERAGYAVTVENALGSLRLPEAIETAGFRTIQQALTNVARHAKAHHVRISLARGPRDVELTVVDDGVGFDVAAARVEAEAGKSLGLLAMKETAMLAGGVLSLTSRPGHGTAVYAVFPLAS
jgi:signal transduction histidine kinase